MGSLSLPITGTGSDAALYRLAGAVFAIDGPVQMTAVAQEDEPLVVDLPAGDYTLELLDGWTLQRLGGSLWSAVPSELTSAVRQSFHIDAGLITVVSYEFRSGEMLLRTGDGRLRVELQVELCIMVGVRPLRCSDKAAESYCETYLGGSLESYDCGPDVETRSTCGEVGANGACITSGTGASACIESMDCLRQP